MSAPVSPWSSSSRWALWFLLWWVALLSMPVRAQVQPPPSTEAGLKAQIIYRALLFVRWPEDRFGPAIPLDLCVFDDSPQAQAITALHGLPINERTLRVRRIAPDQLPHCHAAYVGQSAEVLVALAPRRGVLLVGDRLGLIDMGIMLNVLPSGGRLVFDIGLGSARRQDIDFAVKLLRLARYVKED